MNIIELARAAGAYVYTNAMVPYSLPEISFVPLSLARFATLVRAAALEEAAGVCDAATRYEDWELLGGAEGKELCGALAAAVRNVALAEQPAEQEPVAYMHCPSVAVEGKVRPVLSFEKYEDDYASGIYAVRIPLYTSPPAERKQLTDEEIEQAYRELWRNTPGDVFYTAQNWIEQGIKYAERAHGITGETK